MTYEEAIKWMNKRPRLGQYTYEKHNPLVIDECFQAEQMAIEALEKQEKYRWHDLRKNPEDLPKIGLYVDTRMISCETGEIIPRYACLWEFHNELMWKDVRHGGYEYKACIKWREIEYY